MHVDLEIDHDRRRVVARAQGALQFPDITRYFARLVFDGRPQHMALQEPEMLVGEVEPSHDDAAVRLDRRGAELARKARRLAGEMSTIEDRDRLLDYAGELDERAALLEESIARSA